jgi:hypothetical protein
MEINPGPHSWAKRGWLQSSDDQRKVIRTPESADVVGNPVHDLACVDSRANDDRWSTSQNWYVGRGAFNSESEIQKDSGFFWISVDYRYGVRRRPPGKNLPRYVIGCPKNAALSKSFAYSLDLGLIGMGAGHATEHIGFGDQGLRRHQRGNFAEYGCESKGPATSLVIYSDQV